MSKINPEKIKFKSNDFLVEISDENEENNFKLPENPDKEFEIENNFDERKEEIEKAKSEAEEILQKANREKERIINEANAKAEEIKNEISTKAKTEAEEIVENANKQSLELLENSKAELEKQITSSAKEGYKAGYDDGLQKIKEEFEEKIKDFENFCSTQSDIKNKILKSKDIIDIITNISKKILLKEVSAESIDKIITNTISLLEKKEDISIIVSEKYAKLLYGLNTNTLGEETELKFENFKQYKGFNIIYNPKFDEDTIIIENPSERFDASINAQMDVIIRDIFENTQNGKLDDLDKIQDKDTDKTENEPEAAE